MSGDFVLGVNYWPRRKATAWWKEFDYAEVEAEFGEIHALGLGVVRIFLLWEDFQPQPNRPDDGALRDLEVVLNTAAATGLKVLPTFFTGHACGANWIPAWALGTPQPQRRFPHITEGQETSRGIRDIYTDPELIDAQVLLVRLVTGYFCKHRALYGWDLSNEPGNLLRPRTPQDGLRWLQRLYEEVRRNDARHPVTLGLAGAYLERERSFRAEDIAPFQDFLSVHAYPARVQWARGPLDPDVAPYLTALAATLSGKPVLCGAFGLCAPPEGDANSRQLLNSGNTFCATGKEGAVYYKQVLEKLRQVGAQGALAEAFSDYDPCLWDEPPLDFGVHHRYFGLTTSEGDLKPAGRALCEFARGKPQRVTPPLIIPPDMSPDAFRNAEWGMRDVELGHEGGSVATGEQ